MKMNTKIRYGLRALIEISQNDHIPTYQKNIADNQDIPLKYLDAIITGLKNAGLIVNFGGKRSGYILSRPACKISVYDVYRAFEPELTLVNCTCPGNECAKIHTCPAKDYWSGLSAQIKKQMQATSIEQIIKNYDSREKNLASN